jgi:hypothetical protein
MSKITEIKFSRTFNIGNKEAMSFGVTIQVDENPEYAFLKAEELVWKLHDEMVAHNLFKLNKVLFESNISKARHYLVAHNDRMAEWHYNYANGLAQNEERFIVPDDLKNKFSK